MRYFDNYCVYEGYDEARTLALFKVLLTDSAAVWLDTLPAATSGNWASVKTAFESAFETRYNSPGFMKYKHAHDLFNMSQGDMNVE